VNINRKQFITAAAGLTGGAFLPGKLSAGTTAQIPTGQIKITDVKPYVFKSATYVKIETDAGFTGWGEADHDYPKLTAAVIDEICDKELEGKDPFDSELFWHTIFFKGEDAGSTGLLPGALAGVDNALWDLKGKILGLPVNKISGSFGTEKVKVYGSFAAGENLKTRKTPEQMAKTAVGFVEQGYTTIKARMQIRELRINPEMDDTFEIIKAVRNAVGDNIEIFVDYNNGYSPAKAITLTKKLYEHFNIAAIEEPVTYHDYHGLRQVVDGVDIPVMAGEHEFNRFQMRELITVGNPAFINADLIKAAGFSDVRKIAYMAHAFNKFIMTHNTRPTLATAASLQLVASIPNAARLQEYAGSQPQMGLASLFENSIQFENGYLIVPTIPGLGLIVNEKEMEKQKLN
jgi:L-alanine-DL-glutamate epimerase-like enolase superfamily enzyme